MPLIEVRGEDTITEEILPLFVEGFSLAVVGELSREDGFDVFWVGGEDASETAGRSFDGIAFDAGFGGRGVKPVGPSLEVAVVDGFFDCVYDEVNV